MVIYCIIVKAHCHVVELTSSGRIVQFMWHWNQEQDVLAWGAFFSCYTEVLQSEAFIRTAVGVVMTGIEMAGADGLGGK